MQEITFLKLERATNHCGVASFLDSDIKGSFPDLDSSLLEKDCENENLPTAELPWTNVW